MNDKKKLLILNGSFCELPIILKAKEMGYYVVSTGNAPDLIGHAASDEYLPCDYSDRDAVLHLVKENKIDAIVSCANDFGVMTAAYVAEQMGWKGHDTYENAKLLHHKDLFKDYCAAHHLPAVISHRFIDKETAYRFVQNTEYPIIVKANDLTGGKGITKAENYQEAVDAIDIAFARSRDKVILVEPFIVGSQHTIVTFLSNKKVIASTSCNCYSWVNPYLIQCETFPADYIDELEGQLTQVIQNMAEDLNLADGIFALQYMVKDGKPYIIEMMRRCFGNQFLTLAGLTNGFPWEEAYIRAAMGQSCEGLKVQQPKALFCGHFGVMAQKNGTVKGYEIPQEFKSHIFQTIEMLKPGEQLTDWKNQRIAYLFYTFETKESLKTGVEKLYRDIKITVD